MSTSAGRNVINEAVIIFAKEPVPGRVKTRLAKEIGADEACRIYQTLLDCTMKAIAPLKTTKYMYLPPGDRCWLHAEEQKDLCIRTQIGTNLGERMQNAFAECFAYLHERIVLVGSDCPGLNPSLLRKAFQALRRADTVFGPAADGGYYLIGQADTCRDVFSGIPWSTEKVWAYSRKRLEINNWSFDLLPVLEDIDTLADWQRYEHKLADDRTGITQSGERKQ